MRYNEILTLHKPTALYLQRNGYEYFYEYWIDENNRVDFFAFKNHRWTLFEVGNEYENGFQVEEKVAQILRYKYVASHCNAVLCVPHSLMDDYIMRLCSLMEIEVLYIRPLAAPSSYLHFINSVIPHYNKTIHGTPNLGIFKHSGFNIRGFEKIVS